MKLYLYSMGPDLWQFRDPRGSRKTGVIETEHVVTLLAIQNILDPDSKICFDAHDEGHSPLEAIDKVLNYQPAPIDPRPVHIPPPSQIINGRSVD